MLTNHFFTKDSYCQGNSFQTLKLFLDGGPLNHIETSSLISSANQWTGVFIIGTSIMKELIIFCFN